MNVFKFGVYKIYVEWWSRINMHAKAALEA